jgi:hypothetical protein
LLLHVRVRRKIFKGQHIVGRQTKHPLGRDRPSKLAGRADGDLQGISGLIVGNNNHDRDLGGLGKERQMQRAGGRGESRDTSAPGGEAEVPAYPLERFRVF